MKSKKQKALAILLEIFIVIVGISIAFALERWSSENKEDKLERSYKSSLISDLQEDMDELQSIVDSTDVILKYVGEIFQFTYANRSYEVYTRNHITSTYLATYFYPQNGTYVSLLNSGEVNVIDEFEIKKALSDHYNVSLKELQRTDQIIRNLADNYISPYMLDNIKFSYTRDGIESAEPLKTVKATNMIGSYFNILSNRQRAYKSFIHQSDSLKNLVANTLK